MYGRSDVDRLRIDMVVEGVADAFDKLRAITKAPPDRKAAETARVQTDVLPLWLGYFEGLLNESADGPYFLGSEPSLADIYFFHFYESLHGLGLHGALDAFPRATALVHGIRARPRIAAYLARRPVTPA